MLNVITCIVAVTALALSVYNFLQARTCSAKVADVNAKLIASTKHFDKKSYKPKGKRNSYNKRYNNKKKPTNKA